MAMAMAHSSEVTNQVSQPCPMDSKGEVMTPEKIIFWDCSKTCTSAGCVRHVLLNDTTIRHTNLRDFLASIWERGGN